MKRDLKIISKGLYKEPADKDELIIVKQYIFAREKGRKCLMLRFLNNSKTVVNSLEFWLVEKNSDGVEIAENKIKLNDICVKPGEFFAPQKLFMVKDKCVDFDIKVIVAKSGKYEYRRKNSETYVRYSFPEAWAYEDFDRFYPVQQSKLGFKVRFTSLILVGAIAMVAFAMMSPFIFDVIIPGIIDVFEEIYTKAYRFLASSSLF